MPRKTPEDYLRDCHAEEQAEAGAASGRLKIFLGYASGAGKSLRMLDEARRRRERGEDVVVGALQSSISPEVAPLLEKLEIIPLKFGALDVAAIRVRAPSACVIDGLASNNPPGSANATRWQDVRELLNNSI